MRKSPKLQPLNPVLYGSMSVLLAFSLCYYKLRIFSDTAGYLTDIIRNDGFVIAHNRFISVLNQWLPVLLLKAHASLKAIAIAYSFNYTLVPVALALLCTHWLKRPYHALAIMLLVVLMDVLLFYYAVSELQMGLCLLLFYDGVTDYALQSGKRKTLDMLTLIILPTFAFSHPLCLPVFIGWALYRLLREQTDYRSAGIAILCFFTAYSVKKIWFTTVYEAGKAFTWELVRPFGFNYYDGPFAQSIYSQILTKSFMVLVVLLCTIILLIRMRKYRLLILLITMMAGIFTVILLTFEDWSTHFYDHYHEHMLQPAVFFLVLLFCYALEKVPGRQYLKAGGIAVIFIISLVKISGGREPHVARQKWLYGYLALMDKLHLTKAIVGRVWIPAGMVQGSFWSSNWESLMLSALDGPEKSKTLFMAWMIEKIPEPVQAADEFVTDGASFKQNTLPARYFALDNRPYVFLEHIVPDSVLEQLRRP